MIRIEPASEAGKFLADNYDPHRALSVDERTHGIAIKIGEGMWTHAMRFRYPEPKEYALSDCVNYESNVMGDCGGIIERVDGVVICENCRNKPLTPPDKVMGYDPI